MGAVLDKLQNAQGAFKSTLRKLHTMESTMVDGMEGVSKISARRILQNFCTAWIWKRFTNDSFSELWILPRILPKLRKFNNDHDTLFSQLCVLIYLSFTCDRSGSKHVEINKRIALACTEHRWSYERKRKVGWNRQHSDVFRGGKGRGQSWREHETRWRR